jgi:hypothetical protein
MGYRRLRQVQLLGRDREAATLNNCHECSELIQIQAAHGP